MSEPVAVATIAGISIAAILLQEWRLRRAQERHDAEVARLRQWLSEWNRQLAQARDDARAAQYATVRTQRLHDQAVAQRDLIGQDMAELRDAYLRLAAQHRQTVQTALANGLRNVRIFHIN
ncbi:MAG: hypothetical protein KAX65_07530 [Caldilineaceae bacterium]|nr:hypothetical protein [Caldilineaceae bacterium]